MAQDIQRLLAESRGLPRGIAEIGDIADQAVSRFLMDDIAVYLADASAAAIGSAEIGVGGAAAAFALPLVIIVVVLILVLSWARIWIVHEVRSIPIVGGKLAQVTDAVLRPIDDLEHWVIGKAEAVAGTCIKGAVTFIHWTVSDAPHANGSNGETLIKLVLQPFITELNHLWTWVTDINTWVDHIWKIVEYHTYLHDNTSNTLNDHVNALQKLESADAEQLVYMHTQIGNLYHQLQVLQQVVSNLHQHVHGVRAVNVGYQDLLSEITTMEREIKQLQVHQSVVLDTHTQGLSQLAPLTLLLEAGTVGLSNLRKLEDNPCQCPRLPHLPNELGAALALLEFVENG